MRLAYIFLGIIFFTSAASQLQSYDAGEGVNVLSGAEVLKQALEAEKAGRKEREDYLQSIYEQNERSQEAIRANQANVNALERENYCSMLEPIGGGSLCAGR